MTARARFKQSDVERAVKAWTKSVGSPPAGVRVWPDGSFALLTANETEKEPLDPLEQWEREHGDRAA